LLICASAANAAVGFISSSQVRSGAVFSEVSLQFRCNIHYVDHDPPGRSDVLRIRIEPTAVCTGAPPTVALTKQLHRPMSAQDAWLDSIEYDGDSPGNEYLHVTFTDDVRFDVQGGNGDNTLVIRVFPPETEAALAPAADAIVGRDSSSLVQREAGPLPRYVINIESMNRRPTTAELPDIELGGDARLFVTEATIDGVKWYRVRVGYFDNAESASQQLRSLRERFPGAWIGYAGDGEEIEDFETAPVASARVGAASADVVALMADAKRAMTAGEVSRAVQIYTKVLQQPASELHPLAQEYLALARERNGQIAHAKAEYERYLQRYPDNDGAARVQQRLAALLATGSPAAPASSGTPVAASEGRKRVAPWSLRTFVSQYYRRDVNQVNDQEEVINQSSIYTDVSLDARRRGERFDFASRITAGYRTDLLDEEQSNSRGNDLRVSYAYADLTDARTRLRGRLGRQTRNTGGVLGRFDGFNLAYTLNDKVRFEAVVGEPVYSTSHDSPDSRMFYGLSSTFAPWIDALDFGVFILQQDIEGLTDRSVAGAEMRYFGAESSLWGIVSYDTEFAELGSAFLQGSMRLPGNMTVTGLFDLRRSPFLSLGNALVGQQLESFDELAVLFTETELRQFALDRSPEVATVSFGVSRPFTPKLQFNVNASHSSIGATPESGGVPATEKSDYSYFSTDLVASGLFTEGDVGIIGIRYATSDSTNVYSLNLDTRFPIGRKWRINPRLRVDYREILADRSTQWNYAPGLRIQFRPARQWRIELEGGQQFSRRDMATTDLDRDSRFIYLGYQYFF
jgi:tetratricopeptide (TPR) repeat protein